MSTSGVISRSVRDSAAALDASAGPDLGAPYHAPPPARRYLEELGRSPGKLRIGLETRPFNGTEPHADCVAAAEDAGRLCSELGHRVEQAALEPDRALLGEASRVIIGANTRATLQARARALGRELREDDVEPATWRMVSAAADSSAEDYVNAVRAMHAVGRQVAPAFHGQGLRLTRQIYRVAAAALRLAAHRAIAPHERHRRVRDHRKPHRAAVA